MGEPVLLLIDVHALLVGREAIVHKVRIFIFAATSIPQ